MLDIKAKGFSAPYLAINSLNRLNFSYLYLLRCFTTSSYSRKSQGILHYIEKGAQALNYLVERNGYLGYSDRYYQLEKSDKDVISYRTGEALLKAFCEKEMAIKDVIKIKNDNNFVLTKTTTQSKKSKTKIGNTTKTAREPDFIGIDLREKYHVLETKCRSQYSTGEHQHAINQVQTIDKINGEDPITRSACYFTVSKKKSIGDIIDPKGEINYDLEFNYKNFIRDKYEPFAGFNSENSISIRYNQRNFFIVPFIKSGYFIGCDRGVKQNSLNGQFDETFVEWYQELGPNEELSYNNYLTIGADGIILIDLSTEIENFIEIENLPRRYKLPFHPLFWF